MKTFFKYFIFGLSLLLVGSLNAQEYFPTQAAFEAYLAVWGDVLAEEAPAGVDYFFGVDALGEEDEDLFTIDDDEDVVIAEGLQIEFANDVVLFVDGSLTVGDIAGPATTISGFNGAVWNSIQIRGDGDLGDGVATFLMTSISGGGDAPFPPNTNGLITLTNDGDDTSPQLTLSACQLFDSETNGIYVFDSDDDQVSSTIVINNNSTIGSVADPIMDNGIAYEAEVDLGVQTFLTVNNSIIHECGERGIFHDLCIAFDPDDEETGLHITMDGADIHDNGLDGVRIECPNVDRDDIGNEPSTTATIEVSDSDFEDNGTDGVGWGFILHELSNSVLAIDPPSEIRFTDGTVFNGNSEGGVCMWHVAAEIICFDDCQMNNNGLDVDEEANPAFSNGQGVLVYSRALQCGDSPEVTIENSTITGNGLAGMHLRRVGGHNFDGAWYIQGNNIYDNGEVVAWGPDATDPMEGANLHAYMNVVHFFLTNNYIGGSYNGIYLDEEDFWNEDHWEDNYPRNLHLYNNIQYGEDLGGGLRTQNGLVIEMLPDDLVGWDVDAIYNNVFWENSENGIVIGDADLLATELCNNVFGSYVDANGLVGINFTPGGGPNYLNNSVWNNDDGDYVGCGGANDQDDDPLFVDTDNQDYHIYWSSTLINAGYAGPANDEDRHGRETADADMEVTLHGDVLNRDGTDNDIGAYGGYFANGTIDRDVGDDFSAESEAQDYDWEPYCLIGPNRTHLDGDLLRDYYLASATYYVDLGCDLEIEPGTYIENDEDVHLKVSGEINADGTFALPIIITSYGDVEWDYIWLKSTASIASTFQFCWINNCYLGIAIGSVKSNTPNEAVEIDSCIFSDISGTAIEIYDSDVLITGNEEAWDPEEPTFMADCEIDLTDERCFNQIRDAGMRGLDISTIDGINGVGELVKVDGTKIYLCGIEDDEEPENHLDYAGVYLFNAVPKFSDASIFANYNVGMYSCWSDPDLNWDDDLDLANDFKDNGPDDPDGAVGTELLLAIGSVADAIHCDIVDVNDDYDEANGFSIYLNGAQDQVDAHQVYYHIEDENDWVQADHIGGIGTLLPANYSYANNVRDEENDDDWVADYELTPYDRALAMLKEGRYREAASMFEAIIEGDPTSNYALYSARRLLSCYRQFDGGLDDLRGYYADLIDEEYPALSREVRLLIPRTYIAECRYEDAMQAYNDRYDRADDPIERGLARIAWLQLDRFHNDERINGADDVRRINEEISRILNEMMQIDAESPVTAVPAKFGLTDAYPNPFNSSVRIDYQLDGEADVCLKVFDLSGREVTTLYRGMLNAGSHSAVWDAADAPSGIYICRMESGNQTSIMKVTLVR